MINHRINHPKWESIVWRHSSTGMEVIPYTVAEFSPSTSVEAATMNFDLTWGWVLPNLAQRDIDIRKMTAWAWAWRFLSLPPNRNELRSTSKPKSDMPTGLGSMLLTLYEGSPFLLDGLQCTLRPQLPRRYPNLSPFLTYTILCRTRCS